jgi:N utilization substance protein B
MGIRRKSRELIVQTIYALNYAETDPYLLNLDYINKYKEILDNIALDDEIAEHSNIYKHAEKCLKVLLPKWELIDEVINNHIGDYKFEKIGLLDLIIMRLAVFEMLYQEDRTPPPVMINEAVELAKKFCAEKSPSLVNAILDNIHKQLIVGSC